MLTNLLSNLNEYTFKNCHYNKHFNMYFRRREKLHLYSNYLHRYKVLTQKSTKAVHQEYISTINVAGHYLDVAGLDVAGARTIIISGPQVPAVVASRSRSPSPRLRIRQKEIPYIRYRQTGPELVSVTLMRQNA